MTLRLVRFASGLLTAAALAFATVAPADREVRVPAPRPVPSQPSFRLVPSVNIDSLAGLAAQRRLFALDAVTVVGDSASSIDAPVLQHHLVGVLEGEPRIALLTGLREDGLATLVQKGDSVGTAVVGEILSRSVLLLVGDSTLTLMISDGSNP